MAIRDRGLTPARYYVLLRRAAASLEGQAHDALTAHRVTHRSSNQGLGPFSIAVSRSSTID
jgi:hypothetical protein